MAHTVCFQSGQIGLIKTRTAEKKRKNPGKNRDSGSCPTIRCFLKTETLLDYRALTKIGLSTIIDGMCNKNKTKNIKNLYREAVIFYPLYFICFFYLHRELSPMTSSKYFAMEDLPPLAKLCFITYVLVKGENTMVYLIQFCFMYIVYTNSPNPSAKEVRKLCLQNFEKYFGKL